jgi:N-acetyl sugar amidotransferase
MNTVSNIDDKNFRQCSKSVMDNIYDPNISFDENGISNYYYDFEKFKNETLPPDDKKKQILKSLIDEIKKSGKGKKYDCIVGLSGGADSSYLAYLAKEYGLRPLIVHFDYGWNTDLSIRNIETITKKLDFELFTHVIDWPVMRELQKSYFKASVIDLDVPADHTIFGSIFKIAAKMNIKYILNGSNYQTELIMPKTWNYLKTDLTNIKNIYHKFTGTSLKGIPTNGIYDQIYYGLRGIKSIPLLYYVDYSPNEVINFLKTEFGWINYEGKHFENIYTRFYQGVVLPSKFGVDKRKAHLSNLIFSGQITKDEALEVLKNPTYDLNLQKQDREYVAKKLGFTEEEFETVLTAPNVSHQFYGTDQKHREFIYKSISIFLSSKYKETLKNKILRK